MPLYNTSFDLDVDDLELIETALQSRKRELSLERLELLGNGEAQVDAAAVAAIDATLNATHLLLGRLHNQKVFFRPKATQDGAYIGG